MYHSFLIHLSADGHLGPSNCKQCCDEHWGTRVSFNSGFLSVYAQQWVCWVVWQFYFQFFKESPWNRHYPWGVGWVGSGSGLSRGSGYATLNIPLWHKNYFEFKAFDYLKPSICLKAEPPPQTQWSAIPSPGTTLIFSKDKKLAPCSIRPCHKIIIFLSVLLRVHLSF